MAKKKAKKKSIIKRIASRRLKSRKKRLKSLKERFEAKISQIVGKLEADEIQQYLADSYHLLDEPELQWVKFSPETAAKITQDYCEKHSEELEKTENTEGRKEALDALYAHAISLLAGKQLLFRMKSDLRSLAKRAKAESNREMMFRAICAEAMFRADVHVSSHPALVIAYEKARNEGLGDQLPHITSYSLLDEKKAESQEAEQTTTETEQTGDQGEQVDAGAEQALTDEEQTAPKLEQTMTETGQAEARPEAALTDADDAMDETGQVTAKAD